MTRKNSDSGLSQVCESFVLAHGWRADAHDLAAVTGASQQQILRLRASGACTKLARRHDFAALFGLWNGRPPQDREWPAPCRSRQGRYEWQTPELALLASLVGQLGPAEIAAILTDGLRQRTGDPAAQRTKNSVLLRINGMGMQTSDVLGGITTAEAGRQIGSVVVVRQAIRTKALKARRVGRLLVIPHDAWEAWKAKRVFPPDGYVLLSSFKQALAIRSDKLSEFARLGFVPGAVRCNPFGVRGPSTKFGTWWIDKKVGEQLLADRRAGRPMPWHGKPLMDNLKVTFRLWQQRRHPVECATCAGIWGALGAPASFDEYAQRYPAVEHGAKRHLTMQWTPGLTVNEVASHSGIHVSRVRYAIKNRALAASTYRGRTYVTRTDASLWAERKCPTGDSPRSWISLDSACKQYLFTQPELRLLIASGQLPSKLGSEGAMRGIQYVLRHQCGRIREARGFTEEEAARKVGITTARLRILLEGVDWRKTQGIRLVTVQAVIKRLQSQAGYTLEEAAEALGTTAQWVKARTLDGTVRVSQAKWDRRRVYLTQPMLDRLREAQFAPTPKAKPGADWLSVGAAAQEAGVSTATVIRWAKDGELKRRECDSGRWQYHREAVRAKARTYWASVRFRRAHPPVWLEERFAA